MSTRYTIDRDQAASTTTTTDGSYRYHRANARRLLASHPAARLVRVVDRGTVGVRYEPAAGEILVVPSTGGRWGKSRIVRYGAGC